MKIINCITIGDKDGIGLELIFKIWKNYRKKTKTFFLLGDCNIIMKVFNRYNYKYSLKIISNPNEATKYFNKYLPIINIKTKKNDDYAINALEKSYEYANKDLISGIITLPVNKNKIKYNNKKFTGHTEYFELIDNSNCNMIFIKLFIKYI